MKKYLLVEMPDFSVWRVPVQVIADAMTDYYVEQCGEDREKAKAETELLFTENEDEIKYWASENMDWDEVKSHAVRVSDGAHLCVSYFRTVSVSVELYSPTYQHRTIQH